MPSKCDTAVYINYLLPIFFSSFTYFSFIDLFFISFFLSSFLFFFTLSFSLIPLCVLSFNCFYIYLTALGSIPNPVTPYTWCSDKYILLRYVICSRRFSNVHPLSNSTVQPVVISRQKGGNS